jgi:toxin ParE1/3/4
MPYLIEFSDRAVRDLEFLYIEKNTARSHAATKWFNNLEKAINTLKLRPGRCSVIPERPSAKGTLRHMLYGKKPHVYRVIYEVHETHRLVLVLTIRHGARRKLKRSDVI